MASNQFGGRCGEVVEGHDSSLTQESLRGSDPAAAPVSIGSRAPWGRRRGSQSHAGSGAIVHSTKPDPAVRAHDHLAPTTVEHREPERQVVEQLVGDHDPVNGPTGSSRAERTPSGCCRRCERRHLDRHVAVAPLRRRRRARPGQRAGPGADLDDGEVVRLAEPSPLRSRSTAPAPRRTADRPPAR